MKYLFILLLFFSVNNFASNISYEIKKDILEIERASSSIYGNIRSLTKINKNEDNFKLKHARKLACYIYAIASELYKISVVDEKALNEKDEEYIVNFQTIIPQIKTLQSLYLKLGKFSETNKLPNRITKKLHKMSFHLSRLIAPLIEEGLLTTEGELITKHSKNYEATLPINQIDPDFLDIYNDLNAMKDILRNLNNPKDLASFLSEQLIGFLELIQSEKKINKKYFSEKYKKINDLINELALLEQNLSINEKESLYNLIQLNENITNKAYDPIKLKTLSRKTFSYYRASQVCSLLSSPGDISLAKSKESDPSLYSDFRTPLVARTIQTIEALKFTDIDITYSHAEVISKITSDRDIQTWSYYPWMFNVGKDEEMQKPSFLNINKSWSYCNSKEGCSNYSDYRSSSSILKVSGLSAQQETQLKEDALKRLNEKEKFQYLSPFGVCSDFVNWTYNNKITSNWNQIPGLRHLIKLIWIPEGFQTPDNLYNSNMTQSICELENNNLIYPQSTNLHELSERVHANLSSSNKMIKDHAKSVLDKLKSKGLLNDEGRPLYDIIEFKPNQLRKVY